MVLLNILRMIADVAFYGAFAGFVGAHFDGSGAMLGAVLLCVLFGLSWLGGKRRWLRMLILLPIVGVGYLYRSNPADCIVLFPPAVYIVWLVWRNDYPLQYERQHQLFQAFWKAFLIAGLLFFLWERVAGNTYVVDVMMPYGMLMLVASVLLMRTLRHDKEVYLQRQYQLMNYSLVGLFLLAAGFLSSDLFLNTCLVVLRFVYGLLLKPILQVLLKILEKIIWVICMVISLIAPKSAFDFPEGGFGIDMGGNADPVLDSLELEGMARDDFPWLAVLGWCLLAVGLLVFFRWLRQHSKDPAVTEELVEIREDEAPIPLFRRSWASRKGETSETHKIRSQYKSFLKWCGKQGVAARAHNTSLEIHWKISEPTGCEATSAEIRKLYISARYAGRADQEDAKRMKKLCAQIRQEAKETTRQPN